VLNEEKEGKGKKKKKRSKVIYPLSKGDEGKGGF